MHYNTQAKKVVVQASPSFLRVLEMNGLESSNFFNIENVHIMHQNTGSILRLQNYARTGRSWSIWGEEGSNITCPLGRKFMSEQVTCRAEFAKHSQKSWWSAVSTSSVLQLRPMSYTAFGMWAESYRNKSTCHKQTSHRHQEGFL